jgi:general secretion pathway protein E
VVAIDVISFVNELFQEAIVNRASDIHLEPGAERFLIRQRIDGFLVETASLPMDVAKSVISRLKLMGQVDIGERRIPQDGAMTVQVGERMLEIRLATLPLLYGEKIVLRLLPGELAASDLVQLGMETNEAARAKQLLKKTGLLVVTGPTGAGKTTTLYTLLNLLDHRKRNIVTLEDPIELQLAGVNQVQVHPKIGFSFAKGLRAILRQDPDVIMIGEIRDQETAEIAVEAALTGHLVLTSLHTTDGASVITRLIDMGIPAYLVASSLSGVIAQRLVRLRCSACNGLGCSTCRMSGYFKRSGVFEVLTMDEDIQPLIVTQPTVSQLRHYFQTRGVRTMAEAMSDKQRLDQTTPEEVKRILAEVVTNG